MKSTAAFMSAVALGAQIALAQNCVLQVPPHPESAIGLATPYFMSGCNQIDFSNQGSFVEATILDIETGALQVYHPLVVNTGSKEGVDFIKPVVPTLPKKRVVGIWFGSNGLTLTLQGDTRTCVNGLSNSIFGQFAYCNAPNFFRKAQEAIKKGQIKVPSPGDIENGGTKGTKCPTVRDFRIVDMDQSDNVDTTYLLIDKKVLAQNTPDNAKNNKGAVEISNGSDNALVNTILAPVLGCSNGVFMAPSITAPTGMSPSLALNEIQAQIFPDKIPALVPLNDDFVVINNNGVVTQSLDKVNLYRKGVFQTEANNNNDASGITYCRNFAVSGIFIAKNQILFQGFTSPAPDVANNLFTFMANRFATSFGPVPSLGCQTIFGLDESPVTQTLDGNGVVVSATIDVDILKKIIKGSQAPSKTYNPEAPVNVAPSPTASLGTGQVKHKGGSNVVGHYPVPGSRIMRRFY